MAVSELNSSYLKANSLRDEIQAKALKLYYLRGQITLSAVSSLLVFAWYQFIYEMEETQQNDIKRIRFSPPWLQLLVVAGGLGAFSNVLILVANWLFKKSFSLAPFLKFIEFLTFREKPKFYYAQHNQP